MCGSGAFFPPTTLPLAALLSTGTLLSLAVLGGIFWLMAYWLNQKQTPVLPLASPSVFPYRETHREYEQGSRSSEPKQEYEQPSVQLSQEMPPWW